MNWQLMAVMVGVLCVVGCANGQSDYVSEKTFQMNDNAGWCWFETERAMIHDGKILTGTVANIDGKNGDKRGGNIEFNTYDLKSGKTETFILHEQFENDDHDSPAIYIRRDGKILCVYGKHNNDHFQHWRITSNPGDTSAWDPIQTYEIPSGYTYSNVFRLSAENNRLYNFHRGVGFNPNYNYSDDDGTTWTYGGRLLQWSPKDQNMVTTGGAGRPYLRYTSNNIDTVHFITTEDHPRNFDNSVYYGFVKAGKIYKAINEPVGNLSTTKTSTVKPTMLTKIYQGGPDHVAWTVDLRIDTKGYPYAAISVQMNDSLVAKDTTKGGEDLRYVYARFDGTKWTSNEIAYAGQALYSPEVDYPGLVALHPYNPDVLYISTNADPTTGKPLISSADQKRHYEIFKGHTNNKGKTFTWTPITQNSTEDNIRPVVPSGDPNTTALLWCRGKLTTFTKYNLRLVGMIDETK